MRYRENQALRPQGYVAVTLAQAARFLVTGFLLGIVAALLAVVELRL